MNSHRMVLVALLAATLAACSPKRIAGRGDRRQQPDGRHRQRQDDHQGLLRVLRQDRREQAFRGSHAGTARSVAGRPRARVCRRGRSAEGRHDEECGHRADARAAAAQSPAAVAHRQVPEGPRNYRAGAPLGVREPGGAAAEAGISRAAHPGRHRAFRGEDRLRAGERRQVRGRGEARVDGREGTGRRPRLVHAGPDGEAVPGTRSSR